MYCVEKSLPYKETSKNLGRPQRHLAYYVGRTNKYMQSLRGLKSCRQVADPLSRLRVHRRMPTGYDNHIK